MSLEHGEIKIKKGDLHALNQDLHIIAHGITDLATEHEKYKEFVKQRSNAVLLAGQNIGVLLEKIFKRQNYKIESKCCRAEVIWKTQNGVPFTYCSKCRKFCEIKEVRDGK